MKKSPVNAEIKRLNAKRRRKIFGRVMLGIACIVALFVGVTYAITLSGNAKNMELARSFDKVEIDENITIENYDNGCWDISANRDIKVLQLTDVHFGGGWMSLKKDAMALNAVAAMVTAEKPDLIIITGDMAYPVPFQAGTFNNLNGARLLAELMETLGVPWTVSLGNHDSEFYSFYNRKKVSDFYEHSGFEHCLYQSGPDDVDGYGNQVINLRKKNGLINRTLFILDSHSYTDGDFLGIMWKYDNIHDNQIEWYKNTVAQLSAENVETLSTLPAEKQPAHPEDFTTVKSLVFLHIPVEEYKTAWHEYINNNSQNTTDVEYVGGVAGESGEVVYCGIHPDEFFETMVELGSTQAVFCGHDHLNNFAVNYKGITLSYGMSVDYLAYIGIAKKGAQRGCTVIDVAKNGSFEITKECYYQDKYVSKYEKETVLDIEA